MRTIEVVFWPERGGPIRGELVNPSIILESSEKVTELSIDRFGVETSDVDIISWQAGELRAYRVPFAHVTHLTPVAA